MKTCFKCGESKPATPEYFYRQHGKRDGLEGSCKTCTKSQSQKWHEANRETINESHRRHYEANRERIREDQRKHRAENIEKAREADRERYRKRMQDVGYRVSQGMSAGMRHSLRDAKNGRHWETLVGYSIDELRAHLESQFTKGMLWSNYGAWHVDHRRPVSDFNFTTTDDPEFKECWSLWNLQPLWATENLSKGPRCEAPPLPLLPMED